MLTTRFTELIGCSIPLQQAGMGGVAKADLAAAVSAAGALGTVGGAGMATDELGSCLDDVAARTSAPVGVNFLMPFVDPAAVEMAAAKARLVEFFYGNPEPRLIDLTHGGGALAAWQVGSVEEAKAATAAGCDLVVAQGVEAGGHVRGEVALLPLLDGVLAAVDVPVVAAGGIGTARAMAAVLAAGADGARVGTRFVAAAEANSHPEYVQALAAAGSGDTVLTTTFSDGWPDAPHRVLRSCVAAAEDGGRFAPDPPTTETSGTIGAMALYAGQSVGAVTKVQPAAEIVRELAEGAEALLGGR